MRVLNAFLYFFPRMFLWAIHLLVSTSVTPLQRWQAVEAIRPVSRCLQSPHDCVQLHKPVARLIVLQAAEIHGAACRASLFLARRDYKAGVIAAGLHTGRRPVRVPLRITLPSGVGVAGRRPGYLAGR